MRSLVGFLCFTATLVALLAAFAVPAFVAPVVAAAVRDASPFGDQPLDIEVDVDALGLLRGFVSEIRISGTNLVAEGASVGTLDLTVRGVGVDDHEFESIEGTLGAIDVVDAGGASTRVQSVTLSGPSTRVAARATVEPVQAVALIRAALAETGFGFDTVELVEGGVAVGMLGQRAIVIPEVSDGGLLVPAVLAGVRIPIIAPLPDDAWRITTVRVSPAGLHIEAAVDAGRLLAAE